MVLGLVMFGLSLGCALVPVVKCLTLGAVEVGFDPVSLETFAAVAGLYLSAFRAG